MNKHSIAKTKTFKLPIIIQDKKDIIEIKPDTTSYLKSSCGTFLGKFAFCDTIDLSNNARKHASATFNKKDSFYKSDSIFRKQPDTLNYTGLQIFVDYSTSIYLEKFEENFPIYLVNNTSQTIYFSFKDGYTFSLCEAQDEYRQWFAIEGRCYDFCGNGYHTLCIKPSEFVLIGQKRYKGDFKTNLRVRVKNMENILVSNSFPGAISKNMFIPVDGLFPIGDISSDPDKYFLNNFYGARPDLTKLKKLNRKTREIE